MAFLNKMLTKIKKSSSLALILMLFLSFNLTAVLGLAFAKKSDNLLASSLQPTSVTISNPSFSSYSGSTPRTPTSWTKLSEDSSVISGVVDIDDAKKSTKDDSTLKLNSTIEKYTGMSEDYVLLMNSPSSVSKMGYRSSEFTLSRNSFYVVSFKAYAENGTFGSIYLSGEDFKNREDNYFNITTPYEFEKEVEVDDGAGGKTTEIQRIKSATWKDCYFFIYTNQYFDSKATLDVRLGNELAGSKGAILFDDIKINKYVHSDFETIRASVQNNSGAVSGTLNLTTTSSIPTFVETFENQTLTNWQKAKDCDADNENAKNGFTYLGVNLNKNETAIDGNVSNQGIIGNTGAFFINNTETLSVGYKLKENSYLNIEKDKLYLLTFDALTSEISGEGDVNVKLYAENKDGKYDLITTLSKISTSSEWKTYAFAINSSNLENKKAYIELWVEKAKGYAVFDNFVLNEVSYDNYDKYLTGNSETCKEADVSGEDTNSLNGFFNKTYFKNGIKAPQKWTTTVYNSNGEVVETNPQSFARTLVSNTKTWNVSGVANPGDPNYNYYSQTSNNILVLQNLVNSKQVSKSQSFTISANKYYEVSFDVKTLANINAGIKVLDSNNNVLYEDLFINNADWSKHTIYFVGAASDTTVYFELSLGEDNAQSGTAFFDSFTTREITISEGAKTYGQMFENATNYNVVNLAKTDFSKVNTLSKENGIYLSRDWKYNQEAKVNIGVVDTLKFGEVAKTFGVKNPNLPTSIENVNSKVFMIDSAFEGYYTATKNNPIALDLDSYYKVSFWVLTQGIPQNIESSDYNYGASIKVVDSSVKLGETFSGINTYGEWKEYTLYLHTLTNDEAVKNYNLNITLGLGSSDLQSLGTAYFSEIVSAKIDEAKFNEVVAAQEKTVDDSIITFVGDIADYDKEPEDNKEEDTTQNTNNSAGMSFLYASSIITAVVILFAIIAFAIRSLKIKRPVRIKAEDLNKERMSARNFAFKDKMIEINNKIAVLDDKLFETNKQIDDIYYEKEVDTNKVQELKLQKAEILEQIKQAKQEERELVEQFKKFKKDEHLRKKRNKK